MWKRFIGARGAASLAAGAMVVALGSLAVEQALAQQVQPKLNPDDQLAPSQMVQPMPGAVAEPGAPPPATTPKPAPRPRAPRPAASPIPASVPATAAKPAHAPGVRTVVECSGPFAQDSGMLALAMVYDSRNMIFTHETVPGGGEANVTVLFPNDPLRRLEVWWSNPNRTGTYLIDIAGKSIWTGPDGLRLGLTLEQLEKLNHKPFKMKGFDNDDVASVSSWDDGALASLAGGCKAGVSIHSSAPAAPAELPAQDEYSSHDPAMRALKPTVTEILIGY
jgi:hypothetical protein